MKRSNEGGMQCHDSKAESVAKLKLVPNTYIFSCMRRNFLSVNRMSVCVIKFKYMYI